MIEHTGPEPSRPLRAWIRSSPGTHIWLLIVAVTSVVVAIAPDRLDHVLLHRNSSNIHQLDKYPLRALLSSALWIENPASLALYALLFELFHATVERWLGTLRWLVIVATAHIVATLASQKLLLMAIEDNRAPHSMTHVVDIGVSYGLAASVGVLTYRLPNPWRWLYLAGVVAFFAIPLLTGGSFTDLGHAISLAVGLLAWPLTLHPEPHEVHVSRET
ncbi:MULTISPECIES: rhomboid-like protein [Streptomyces]|uniref:Membrane protein n=1 Tax=Streptomyces katrae TaxID=68223 RepID=A0A0F4K0F7_9ACTN|nr:rhomboid-like protein [Streptomyces katrae]KJY39589.1 membrane protein [Streptomyces katrae]